MKISNNNLSVFQRIGYVLYKAYVIEQKDALSIRIGKVALWILTLVAAVAATVFCLPMFPAICLLGFVGYAFVIHYLDRTYVNE